VAEYDYFELVGVYYALRYYIQCNISVLVAFNVIMCRIWPGRHFLPGSKSEYLDVLFAGSKYEPSIISLHVQISYGICAWIIGCQYFYRQPSASYRQ